MDFNNFSVPKFDGFEDAVDNEEVENYFEYDHETDLQVYIKTEGSTSSECEYEWFSPKDIKSRDFKNDSGFRLRKSMSTGNLFVGQEDQRRLELIGNRNQPGSQCDVGLGTNKTCGNGNKVGKQHGNRQRFVSVAEMASKFWMQTPERFRSESRVAKTGSTVPKTPQLCTKNRARAITILSREQLEELEIKEAQKHQIKARPLNKRILAHPAVLAPLAKKDATIPKPFNLTEVNPKKTEQQPNIPSFHARAIPKSIYMVPKHLRVPLITGGKLTSHCGSKTKPIEKVPPKPYKPLTTTEPAPFSFDYRDKQMMKKKEDFINKILEEEKKAREFKAKPVPKRVTNKANGTSTSSIKSSNSNENLDSAHVKPFKAAFPKVLYQEPFIPKRAEEKVLTEISFQLNTELRAQKRKEFDNKLQEKQEGMNKIKFEREEEEKERQRVEVHNLRKEIEFKANPVRRFKEFHIQPSGKVTIPMSPNFKSAKLNKENISE